MSTELYTALQRLTIEALDCVIKPPDYDSQGHLHISIEPRIPVESVQRNADPLLSQTIDQQKHMPLTTQTDTSQLTLSDTMPSPLSITEDIDHSPCFSPLSTDSATIPPVPDNKISQTTQTQTVDDNFDISDFVKSQRFQEKLKTVKTKLSEEISQAIPRRPEEMRDWILQILYKYPDLLDDKSGPTVGYIPTAIGNIQVNQPSYDRGQPDTTQTDPVHVDDDTQQTEGPNDSTEASDLNTDESRVTTNSSDSEDSEDCIIEGVDSPPETEHQAEAPPPDMPKTKAQLKAFPDGAMQQILLQLPSGNPGRLYTVTTMMDQTQTHKRHRPRDNLPQPSTSTGTDTESGNSKHKKHKKKKKQDKS